MPGDGRPVRLARVIVPLAYVPALVLGIAHVVALARSGGDAGRFVRVLETLDRVEFLYLAGCLIGGLAALARALTEVRSITGAAAAAVDCVGHCARRRALRDRLRAAVRARRRSRHCRCSCPAIPLGLIPLAYASAIVRYRLMDIEVIVKRALVYAAALGAIVAIYAALLQGVQRVWLKGDNEHDWMIAFLATLVALLLAPPVKSAVQNALDRAFYRDRYDYRRALVGFARDLNSDLDLHRLSERLVSRVVETLLVDRMALMLEDEAAPYYGAVRASGFGDSHPPALPKVSGIGERLAAGHIVALDDPIASTRFPVEEIEYWRDTGLYYFVPCLAKEGAIAVLARRPQGHRRAAEQRGHGSARRGGRTDCHGARKRTPLSAAPRQGARARSDARLQREHSRIARRRPARPRSERSRRPLESRDGGVVGTSRRAMPPAAASTICSTAPFVEALRAARARCAAGRDAIAAPARTAAARAAHR